MKKQIKRLRLREGDLVVVHHPDDAEAIIMAARQVRGIPNCPIIVARESIHRLSKEYLTKLLANSK